VSKQIISNRILQGILAEFKKDFQLNLDDESKLFEKLVNYVSLSKIDPEAFSEASIFDAIDVDKKSTFGIDSFALFINDNLVINKSDIDIYKKAKRMDIKFVFIQTKRSSTIDSGDFLKFTTAVKNFFADFPYIGLSDELQNAKELVDELFIPENARLFSNKKPTCELFYATAGVQTNDETILGLFKQEEANLKMSIPEVSSVFVKQIDSDYIIDSYNEIENSYRVVIDFDKNLPCGKIEDVEQSYVGYLPASEFLKLITGADGNIRKNLFYENVRDFQGDENAVNHEIADTLNNPNLIDKFLLLNNGVTVVAKDFSNIRSNEYEISDYYIVNGCQTSNVIYNFKDKIIDNPNLNIPIKLIHTTSNELISKLIRSTNRQTPVPDEAFVSLEKFHKRLQEFYRIYSQSAFEKLYYERRSKEFTNSHDRIERPRIVNLHAQIRSFTSIILGEPQLVTTNNPSSILKSQSNRLFVEGQKFTPYYLASLYLYLFYQLNQKHQIHDKYVISRYWICWIANILAFKSLTMAQLNSSDIEEQSEKIISKLSDKQYSIDLFTNAIKVFNLAKSQHEEEFGKLRNGEIIRLKSLKDIVKQVLLKTLER
jgi:hypothetical protein